MVGRVQGLLSPDGNRCKGLPENKIGIERRIIRIGQCKRTSASDNGISVMESENSVLESGTSELESGAKDSESVTEMEITKQAGNSAVQGEGISIEGTAANGTEAESGIEHPTPEESAEGNGGGCNNGTKDESSVNVPCGFKMEKMPRFAGDVRDYAIFRSDFKHTVDSRYSKRDAISLLRTSLQG